MALGTEITDANCTVIILYERCKCSKNTAFQYQCKYELVADGKLVLEKYASMWLNNHKFLEINPNLSPYLHLTSTNEIFDLNNNDTISSENLYAPNNIYSD